MPKFQYHGVTVDGEVWLRQYARLDRGPVDRYCICMVLTRALMVALLAVFVSGSVVHAAGTTVMAIQMDMMEHDADMKDCEGCADDGQGNAPCDLDCIAPLLATVSPAETSQAPALNETGPCAARCLVGRTGPPELHPPRFLS